MRNDRSWMYIARRLPEFENGVIEFLNVLFSKAVHGSQIRCPCKRCMNRYWLRRHEVYDHLKAFGFVENYYVWTFHGEDPLSTETIFETLDEEPSFNDNTDTLLDDRFRSCFEGPSNAQNGPNDEAKKFYKLLEEGQQELFPGCKNFSKLSIIIRLFLYKTLHGISNVAFNDLLKLLRDMVSEAKIPVNFTEAKNIVSRRIPAKVLWHFPLQPRLQRVYMNSEIAEAMTWLADKRPKDGYLRHPADGLAWKDFDSLYPLVANEPRNVRLGLAFDGFNPFRIMSVSHSTWPVVLVNYNLPPWMFMKPEYFMLSLLIPGPEGSRNNIDVYLQPLIEELKDLWNVGLETYDKFRNETFKLHATLTWTISDFLGNSIRRFLDVNDPLRCDKKSFNGKVEERPPPIPLTGFHVLEGLSDFVNSFGKKERQKNKSDCPWKKKSIFFELAYWKHNKCRHNLDVMHIEKNVFDNVLGTLLDISGKSKDHPNVRFDLLDMGIKVELQRQLSEDQRHVFFPKPKGKFLDIKVMMLISSHITCFKLLGRPEGSIAEGYLIEECMNFCSQYVDGASTRYDKTIGDMSATEKDEPETTIFGNCGHPLGGKKKRNGRLFTLDIKLAAQAHREHEAFVNSKRRKSKWKRARNHSHEFPNWLKEKASQNGVSEEIFWLAKGPSPTAKSSKDKNPVDGDVTYYGEILEIIKLNYWSKFTVVLFRCEWYQVEKDEYEMTCVNVNKYCSVDDPFVMPSQVHQVFYVVDPIVDGLQYVMTKVPRDIFDYNIETAEPNNDLIMHSGHVQLQENIRLSREDIGPTVVDANTVLVNTNNLCDLNNDSDDNDDTLWDWMQAEEENNDEDL
ncbi:uncharacterized protein LOC141607776 [Silene latifolia]|uniref:uncharacterized protein LOC141607776 n=1 Tax=Silene latifolia TaxID=37657 RepID=UPI003D779A84